MPNRDEHIKYGTFAGSVSSAWYARNQELPALLVEVLGGVIGGYIGGRLPDIIEPATSPNHRGLAHSMLVGTGNIALLPELVPIFQESIRNKPWIDTTDPAIAALDKALRHTVAGFLAGVVAGYASHLVLDARTPRGLPFLA